MLDLTVCCFPTRRGTMETHSEFLPRLHEGAVVWCHTTLNVFADGSIYSRLVKGIFWCFPSIKVPEYKMCNGVCYLMCCFSSSICKEAALLRVQLCLHKERSFFCFFLVYHKCTEVRSWSFQLGSSIFLRNWPWPSLTTNCCVESFFSKHVDEFQFFSLYVKRHVWLDRHGTWRYDENRVTTCLYISTRVCVFS